MSNPIIIALTIAVLTIVFHCLILVKVVPYTIAWGGRLKDDKQMYVFESLSIIILLLLIAVLLMKGDYISSIINGKALDVILWIFFGLFLLNTVGNLFAKTKFEKYFAIITGILAVLMWMILY
jgi:hypothetical protein